MILEPVCCPQCQGQAVIKHGTTSDGKQLCFYQNLECSRRTFILQYSYQGYLPNVKQQISDMAMNSTGIQEDSSCASR